MGAAIHSEFRSVHENDMEDIIEYLEEHKKRNRVLVDRRLNELINRLKRIQVNQ